ncbi:Ribosomal RNA small subunit methyltransferase C [Marinomonas aquimarina]|uniref:Ribosomal RNA small subunit methyltransferase C n=1 Tax=Marinomonas aquimarina TaxID=295068 RepID=A0A1A8TMG3_9GAMM|nr:class I SAM-dependent methyltransferase [Marinomonas aquimarina]SBS34907.1 Ribosomal RNA small subunit methyltransferase C [Marinomonas aquimarina]
MTLNPPSLLLERNETQFSGKVLFANPEDTYPRVLSRAAEVFAWCQSYASYEQLGRVGMSEDALHFGAQWDASKASDFDHVIIYQPKAKELLDYLLAVTLPLLKQGGSVWLVGDNKSGVKSAMKRLVTPLEEVGKVDSAKHCLLFCGRKLGEAKPFVFEDWITSWQQEVAGQTVTLCSIPGVFGHGKLDKGTALLLEQLAKHRFMSGVENARLLDFGCGDGIISIWLHKKTGASISALDDSALALKATELTFAANQASEALTAIASNGLTNAKGRYNYVITNPPFHTGISTDYSIAERFFIDVKKHLTLNGELFVVANDFLRYPPLMDAALGKHQTLLKGSGFAVYHARQQKS